MMKALLCGVLTKGECTMNITQEQLNNAVQEALKGALGGLPAMQTQGNNITLKEFGAGFMKDKKNEISNTAYAKSDSLYRPS